MHSPAKDAEHSDVVSHYDLSDYAGYWVALTSSGVAATGISAREALLNFRAHRLKDDPILRWVPSPDRAIALNKQQAPK